VGTLSKALGCFGAYVVGSEPLTAVLLNRARSLIFSTALPAAICAAAELALQKAAAPDLRLLLSARREQAAQGLGLRADSAVFSLVLGGAPRALEASARLRASGLLVKAIRPPTVPEGTSRLRISVSAAHSLEELQRLIDEVRALGLSSSTPPPAALTLKRSPHDDR
jgi:8-amino-7-oxononanoate synthase